MALGRAKWPQLAEMRASGMGVTQIADALGYSKGAVSETLRLPEVVEMIDEIHAEAREAITHQLKAAAVLGLSVLVELAQGRPIDGVPTVNDSVRRQAASDLLDRCGVTKETAVRIEGQTGPTVVVDVSKLTLEELLDRAEEGDDGSAPLEGPVEVDEEEVEAEPDPDPEGAAPL